MEDKTLNTNHDYNIEWKERVESVIIEFESLHRIMPIIMEFKNRNHGWGTTRRVFWMWYLALREFLLWSIYLILNMIYMLFLICVWLFVAEGAARVLCFAFWATKMIMRYVGKFVWYCIRESFKD